MTRTERRKPAAESVRTDRGKKRATNVAFTAIEEGILDQVRVARKMPSRAALLRALVIEEGERLGFLIPPPVSGVVATTAKGEA